MRVACKLFYLGDNYRGFQFQPDVDTVEGKIKEALKEAKVIKDDVTSQFQGASRTDALVHALGNVFAFNTNEKVIIPMINQFLPKDIIVWAKKEVKDDFLPRFEAIKRHYKYITRYNDENFKKIEIAAKKFIGYHDFKNFSKKYENKNTFREIIELNVSQKSQFLIFDVIGTAFLYQMVRRIVNLLLDIGKGKLNEEIVDDYFSKELDASERIGPAPLENEGSLILWDIVFPFSFEIDAYSFEKLQRYVNNFWKVYSLRLETMELFQTFFNE
ncbi:MAG: tRNA pseudouridine(38-40) synthase TruA [Promethearchaeota archaeon]